MNPKSEKYTQVAQAIANENYDPEHVNLKRILVDYNPSGYESPYYSAAIILSTYRYIFAMIRKYTGMVPEEMETYVADMDGRVLEKLLTDMKSGLDQERELKGINRQNEQQKRFKDVLFARFQ